MYADGGNGRKWLRRAGWMLLALGVPMGALVGMNLWIGRSAEPYLFERVDDVPERLVAIVPGAGVHPDGTPSVVLADRLAAALDLYRAGRVRRILVSGDHGAVEYDEPKAMRTWLLARDVASEDILVDHAGFRTLDTMQRAHRVFKVRDAIVCTQKFHLARAVFLARRAGVDAVGLVADRHADPHATFNAARELAGRARAFLDTYVLGTQPRYPN